MPLDPQDALLRRDAADAIDAFLAKLDASPAPAVLPAVAQVAAQLLGGCGALALMSVGFRYAYGVIAPAFHGPALSYAQVFAGAFLLSVLPRLSKDLPAASDETA